MSKHSIEIIETKDRSKSLISTRFNETYHSVEGAYSESLHIFVNLGLKSFVNKRINILEVGYGSGLNAILSYKYNKELKLNNQIYYHGIELYPIPKDKFFSLKLNNYLTDNITELFYFDNDKEEIIDENFTLLKTKVDFTKFDPSLSYDLVYFDAFSPTTQPEMWTYSQFEKLSRRMSKNSVIVTYCCRGFLKNSLRELGYKVDRHPGPPGKRHVLRAIKNK